MENHTRNVRPDRLREQQLKEAMAAQEALKQQKAEMIRAVARSPAKKRPTTVAENGKPASPQKQTARGGRTAAKPRASIPAYRPFAGEVESSMQTPEPPRLSAPSPKAAPDTIEREIDAAIARSVAGMLSTPPAAHTHQQQENNNEEDNDLEKDDSGMAVKGSDNNIHITPDMKTPEFMTARTKATYCELDDPGHNIPYPGGRRRRKAGLFERLFSCFGGGKVQGSPMRQRPHSGRPSSGKLSPPLPGLAIDIAPLRMGTASLAYNAPPAPPPSPPVDVDALRQNLARTVAANIAANPPTPRFGGMPHMENEQQESAGYHEFNQVVDNNNNGHAVNQVNAMPQQHAARRQAPLRAVHNDTNAALHAAGVKIPLLPVAHTMPPAPVMQQEQPLSARRNIMAPPAAMNPPAVDNRQQQPRHQAPPVNMRQQVPVAAPVAPQPPAAAQKTTEISLQELLANAMQQPQHMVPSVGSRGQMRVKPQSAPTSPVHRRQQRAAPRAGANNMKPLGPAPVTARATASPLKQPTIQPRMTKAAVARNQANHQRIEEEKRRGHWTNLNLAAHAKTAKGAVPVTHNQQKHANSQQLVVSERQQKQQYVEQQHDFDDLPTSHFVVQPSVMRNSISCPSSPRGTRDLEFRQTQDQYLHMLERLQMGMSVESHHHGQIESPPMMDPLGYSPDLTTSQVVIQTNDRALAALDASDDAVNSKVLSTYNKMAPAVKSRPAAPRMMENPLEDDEMVASQKMVSIHEAAIAANQMRHSVESVAQSGTTSQALSAGLNNTGSLLDQLLSMERSLTIDDLEQLKATIRSARTD